jgi:hypothetical protein
MRKWICEWLRGAFDFRLAPDVFGQQTLVLFSVLAFAAGLILGWRLG